MLSQFQDCYAFLDVELDLFWAGLSGTHPTGPIVAHTQYLTGVVIFLRAILPQFEQHIGL